MAKTANLIPLPGAVERAPASLNGFDVDTPLSATQAHYLKSKGYDFCLRYVPRLPQNTADCLTNDEAILILNSGLALMPIQHASPPGWMPDAALGKTYGATAATYANEKVGIPPGMNLWCDLEGISRAASPQDVVAFCNAWYDEVNNAGYIPAIYLGYDVILTPDQLYHDLYFRHYWRAFNGPDLAVRGYQMRQKTAIKVKIGNVKIEIDPDFTQDDIIGDAVIWLSPQSTLFETRTRKKNQTETPLVQKIFLKSKSKIAHGKHQYQFLAVAPERVPATLTLTAETDAEAFASAHAAIDGTSIESYLTPPEVKLKPGDPAKATAADIQAHAGAAVLTLEAVAANWKDACILKDKEENNCAHYLSDAFIRAGYGELAHGATPPAPQISIWCDYNDPPKNKQARVIRAREMNGWFRSKCPNPLTSRPVNKGLFAVFQLDEAVYWGGHVLLYDSNRNVFYGTGAYWSWPTQLFYQW